MAIERLSPLKPVRLRDFGTSISWLMCRNALCENFGVCYDGPHPEGGAGSVSDARYRLDLANWQAKCRHCGLSFQMLPNQAARPLARHFLSLSLPFADCPDPECANHGLNLFENCPPKGAPGPRRYRWSAPHQAVCCACQGRFTVGEANSDVDRPQARQNDRGSASFDLRLRRQSADSPSSSSSPKCGHAGTWGCGTSANRRTAHPRFQEFRPMNPEPSLLAAMLPVSRWIFNPFGSETAKCAQLVE